MTRAFKLDWVMVIVLLVLSGLGIAVGASVAPQLFWPQIIFYVLGFILLFVFSQIDYRIFTGLYGHVYVISLALLILTALVGSESRGAVRWINLGPAGLQFSEVLKPFLIVAGAGFLAKQSSLRGLAISLALFLVPVFLVFRQPDLGNAIVYFVVFLTMLFLSPAKLASVVAVLLGPVFVSPLLWRFLADYQKQRLLSFFAPHLDPLGASYNAIQAVITVGSGEIFGKGIGKGTQSHLLFLPERHTDFAFASLSEEFGFAGSFIVLFCFFVLIWRILSLAQKTTHLPARLICVGMGTLLLFQVFVNVGMNLGIVPVTGITLPLISYGGSSVLATMICLGIVENIVSSQQMG